MKTLILDTLQSIRNRRTLKVISEQALPTKPFDTQFIETLMESAYYAPQHYPCHGGHQVNLPSPLPWRFYVLDSATCRELSQRIATQEISGGKIIGMLNAADYLIQATWCPLPGQTAMPDSSLFDGNIVNMEHIAATGAAIQNLLLTATALGHENYWSSGGVLREAMLFDWLSIPTTEILLGSLFIFPDTEGLSNDVQALPSKRRDQRGAVSNMYRIVEL